MEKTVLRIFSLKLLDRCGLAIHGITNQMMPAQDLMKDDSVRKTSESDAQDESGPDQGIP